MSQKRYKGEGGGVKNSEKVRYPIHRRLPNEFEVGKIQKTQESSLMNKRNLFIYLFIHLQQCM